MEEIAGDNLIFSCFLHPSFRSRVSLPSRFSSDVSEDIQVLTSVATTIIDGLRTSSSSKDEASSEARQRRSLTSKDEASYSVVQQTSQTYRTSSVVQGSISKSDAKHSLEELESQVAYLLARQYFTIRAGNSLGFLVFNEDMHVLGFFQDLTSNTEMKDFIPIYQLEEDFDIFEQEEAARMLRDAIESHSKALYCTSNYDSVHSLLASASSELEKNQIKHLP
jgi:hypothetical protein